MKKIITLLVVLFFPLLIVVKGGNPHLLNYYRINHADLLNNINTFVIPFLRHEQYSTSENVLDISFVSHDNIYIHVSVERIGEIPWNNNIIGFSKIGGYTCILSGDSNNRLLKKTLWKLPQIIVFNNNPELFCHDGTIEWLFRFEIGKVKFIRFNSEW